MHFKQYSNLVKLNIHDVIIIGFHEQTDMLIIPLICSGSPNMQNSNSISLNASVSNNFEIYI